MTPIKIFAYILILINVMACSSFSLFVPNDRVIHQETGYLIFLGKYSYFSPIKVDTSELYYLNDFFKSKKIDLYFFQLQNRELSSEIINCCSECFSLTDSKEFVIDTSASRNCDLKSNNIGYLAPVTLTYYIAENLAPSTFSNKDIFSGYYEFKGQKVKVKVHDILIDELLEGYVVKMSQTKIDKYAKPYYENLDTNKLHNKDDMEFELWW